MLLTNTQILRICKAFANYSSTNIKLWETQLSKVGQSGGVLGSILGSLLETGLALMRKVLKSLAKSIFRIDIRIRIPLGLIAAGSAIDAAIQDYSRYYYVIRYIMC